MSKNPREAAFLALYASSKQEHFVSDWLRVWNLRYKPTPLDFSFAQEIAFGATRMALSLDYIASKLTTDGKLKLKPKERALLRTAIYQACMMDRVPLFAIVDETVKLAKRHTSQHTAKFMNALLRKLEHEKPPLPQGNSPEEVSIRFSYPLFLVELFFKQFGSTKAIELLTSGNLPAKTTARVRQTPFQVIAVEDVGAAVKSQELYIQNETPVILIKTLFEEGGFQPKNILDLCAAPGGKLLLAHDLFPKATLFANDVSEDKLALLKENAAKYQLEIDYSCSRGEDFQSDQLFDLIILDIPCSNTGVLNKRPEARFRVSPTSIDSLTIQAKKLIEKAVSLLAKEGRIWFMTCSILEEENQKIVDLCCQEFNLKKSKERLVLPENGQDGGYAVELRTK